MHENLSIEKSKSTFHICFLRVFLDNGGVGDQGPGRDKGRSHPILFLVFTEFVLCAKVSICHAASIQIWLSGMVSYLLRQERFDCVFSIAKHPIGQAWSTWPLIGPLLNNALKVPFPSITYTCSAIYFLQIISV